MTTKKQKFFTLFALLIAFTLGMGAMYGCAYLTDAQTADINKTISAVLDIAYNAGGATLVEQEIDRLAADGKITSDQAAALRAAAQESYEALQAKLTEIANSTETTESTGTATSSTVTAGITESTESAGTANTTATTGTTESAEAAANSTETVNSEKTE